MTGVSGVALLAASALISGLCGTLAVSLLKVRGRTEQIIALGLLVSAQLVLLAQGLSIFELFRPGFFLAGQIVLALTVVSLWLLTEDRSRHLASDGGLPTRAFNPRRWLAVHCGFIHRRGRDQSGFRLEGPRVTARRTFLTLRALHFSHWTLICLAAIVGGVLLFELLLALIIAPNNYDSMTYHLSRAAYWIQFHTIEQFPEATTRQATFPPNAEILSAWTMLLTRSDHFTQLIQWISMVGVAAAIYCWALLLEWGRQAALFASLVFALLTLVILEATSTQNDLVVTVFLIAAALFLYRGLRDSHRGELFLGAIALGLAVGTKTSALFMLPGITLLAAAATQWRLASLVRPAGVVVLAVLFLGSFAYIQNFSHGYVFGDIKTETRTRAIDEAFDNFADVTSKLADSGGYKTGWLDELKLPRPSDTISEDFSAYGPVGLLIVLPLVVGCIVFARRRPLRRWLALSAVSYLVLFGLIYKENDYAARLLMPVMAFGAPLVAGLWKRQVIAGIVISLSLSAMLPALLTNPNKPVITPPGLPIIFDRSHQEQRTIVNGDFNDALNNMKPLLSEIDRVAVAGGEDTWDYPYFGKDLEREVLRVDPQEVDADVFRATRVSLVIWADIGPPPRMPGVRARKVSRVIWELTPR